MSAFERTIARGLSVRDVERLVRDRTASKRRRSQPPAGGTSSSLESVEDHLRHALGTKVQVKRLRDGKGEIIIEYYSSEDLERILELLSEGRNR
jgi:ParB family transcriptional regulator, chromosome partitioning protein